ncbi:glycine betaine transporter [Staphylococcus auricularis]|uniref:BCCT family transporter n=1 Tax=Staphylococcus auricularis TaxID=29379 RepID=A0AAP8PNT9_9STAP|nr:BCCT family transporter [Staphylococcus auricularis]MCG7341292.1 BCCT family transporter [Staphylococcus auricularis]MDC6327381.1 BCCT family transporter [Staphylococcus auricularis]MDN4534046.1 BCCT family transporter [Staphylococcus auricularis]PNZ67372.1 BCCT family transporter [Staphylococcus auricularis]QPT05989.1 BCCT family transporter [Staphylococcus auricularis]
MAKHQRQFSNVFIYAISIVVVLVILGAVFPQQFGKVAGIISTWINDTFGWYYMLLFTVILAFCVFLLLSPIGKLKLGKPTDQPEFNTLSWLAMLFSAGMGIGLVFYGTAEPISHYLAPPTADPQTKEAMGQAFRSAFMDFGFHTWAVYGIVALIIAYSQFRRGENGLISKTLRPILGDRVDGFWGDIVDTLSVFATVIGVAVTLGVGAIQINGGLNYLFGIPNNALVQGIIIALITILFLYSAWSGLSKGIQYLSNLNMVLAIILLLVIFIVGPTLLILNMMSTGTGIYLNTFLFESLDVAPLNEQKSDWLQQWTIYSWGWWMSWSPFVGIFIARISKGRSIREFIIGVLGVPVVFSIIWFSTFGATGIKTGQAHESIFKLPPETQLFGVFDHLPFGFLLSIIALALIVSFFVTSGDSAAYVLGMQTSFGTLNPSGIVKVVWGVAFSAIAYVLLLAGGDTGLNALQSAALVSALPFSFVVALMMIAFYKDANRERKDLGLTIKPDPKRYQEYVDHAYDEQPQQHENK